MASIKYKTEDGYVSIPMTVPTKSNEENGNGIGTCDTSYGTSLEVTLSRYELVANGFVAVTFANDVPSGATLNINSKGAKPIYYKGSAITADVIKAGKTVMFCYDGTNYVVTSLGGSSESGLIYGYITLDQTSSDPTTKVLDENGNGYANYQRPDVITAIRNASHRYVGTFANDVMSLKQLSDTDGTMYADGTSAATDIATQGKDVFMRLPYFFTRATEVETDKWKIEFCFDENQTTTSTAFPEGENWKQWGGNDLIGVYKAYASDNGNNGTGGIYSYSGVNPNASISQENFKTKSRNRGTGYACVKWRHHCIMAILFYAYYGHTNCQLICGSGGGSTKVTGLKNSLGMTDTNSSNGNTDSINFWGLENWWSYLWETVDNASINNGVWTIIEDDNTERTPTNTVIPSGEWFAPSKFIITNNLDVIASLGQTGGSDSQGYCDGIIIANAASRAVYRSNQGNSPYGGVGCFSGNNPINDLLSSVSTRLSFTGTIRII